MMLYPLPRWNQVLHQAQCFCILVMAHPTPPPPNPPVSHFFFLFLAQAKWKERKTKSCKKYNIIFFHITGILKAIVKYQKSNICVFDI